MAGAPQMVAGAPGWHGAFGSAPYVRRGESLYLESCGVHCSSAGHWTAAAVSSIVSLVTGVLTATFHQSYTLVLHVSNSVRRSCTLCPRESSEQVVVNTCIYPYLISGRKFEERLGIISARSGNSYVHDLVFVFLFCCVGFVQQSPCSSIFISR